MEAKTDYTELLALFNANEVRYIIMRPDRENGGRILRALEEFGFGSLGLTVDDFSVPDRVVQLGVPPVRVDIVTSITGVSWDEAEASRLEGRFGNVPVSYIGKDAFIRNKRALGRIKDLADAEALGEDQ